MVAVQSVLGASERAVPCDAEALLPGGAFSGCRNLLAVARGALLAGELDRALAAKDSSLLGLVGGWLRETQKPLTLAGLSSALLQSAGKRSSQLLTRSARGEAIVPPSGAFGPCFGRERARLLESRLGFEYERDAAAVQRPRPRPIRPAGPSVDGAERRR